jgi:hypothetical protein
LSISQFSTTCHIQIYPLRKEENIPYASKADYDYQQNFAGCASYQLVHNPEISSLRTIEWLFGKESNNLKAIIAFANFIGQDENENDLLKIIIIIGCDYF